MARCTLDDLVPSARCNRVFLEPISDTVDRYEVLFDLSIYDVIDDENGIADYLLSEDVQNNIKFIRIYSRTNKFKLIVDLLKQRYNAQTQQGMSPAIQALLLSKIIAYGPSVMDIAEGADLTQSEGAKFLSSIKEEFINQFLSDPRFREQLETLLTDFLSSDYEISEESKFPIYPGYGKRTFNEEGQIEYDLKIPRQSLKYVNKNDVQNAYLHIIPSYDLVAAYESLGVEGAFDDFALDEETVEFFYKEVHECPVLVDGLPANGKVQDFRKTERIAEIFRTDRIPEFEDIIDNVYSAEKTAQIVNKNSISELFTSFHGTSDSLYTTNHFYFSLMEFLIQNARYPFLYRNIGYLETDFDLNFVEDQSTGLGTRVVQVIPETVRRLLEYFEINKMEIYRKRKDFKTQSVRVATFDQIVENDSLNYVIGYTFEDRQFSKLEDGEYTYEIQLEAYDPMENLIEELTLNTKRLSSRLSGILSLINNRNVSNNNDIEPSYNELRDELSEEMIAEISAFNSISNSDLRKEINEFRILFTLFTQQEFFEIASPLQDIDNIFRNKRLIENFGRIVDDVLFEIQKYYEIKDITKASLSSINPSSIINLNKTWNANIPSKNDNSMILDFIGNQAYDVSFANFEQRMNLEAERRGLTGASLNLGFVTPEKMDNLDIYNSTSKERLSKMVLDLIETPVNSNKQKKIVADLFGGEYVRHPISDLKNNFGAFQTLIGDLGVTVTNKSARLFSNTAKSLKSETPVSFGVDDGVNTPGTKQLAGQGTYNPVQIPTSENDSSEQDDGKQTISERFFNDLLKREDLISRVLTYDTGYSLLDRENFIQGNKRTRRLNFEDSLEGFEEDKNKRNVPSLFESKLESILTDATGTSIDSKVFNRLILDNTFLIYYLESFDKSMQPVWVHLTDISKVGEILGQKGRVFCKLKRYQSSSSNIGQGAFSDREIFLKYFYLTTG